MPNVLSVNIAPGRTNPATQTTITGIDKHPADGAVAVSAPGPMRGGRGSGLAGDVIGDKKLHGGDDQAVYAYANEDLDRWQRELGRDLSAGVFGENLTTSGVDVTEARIGERWRVGDDGLLLEVSTPRTPCRTFAAWLDIGGWMKTFTAAAAPGAYLRVIAPGSVRAGDRISVVDRPDHDVTIGVVFRAITLEPDLLPRLLEIDALPEETKAKARKRSARRAG